MDKKIFVVAKREYLERVRSRWFIAMTLLVVGIGIPLVRDSKIGEEIGKKGTEIFSFFLIEYLFFERVHLYTWDFVAEGVGFKLGWGCFVFYPYFYGVGLWTTAELAWPGGKAAFVNINTPEELREAEARLVRDRRPRARSRSRR